MKKEGRVLSFQPDADFFRKRAARALESEDFDKALKSLRRALELDPDNMEYKLDLAEAFTRMRLFERSNLELQLLFHRTDLPPEAMFGMASNFMSLGDYDQAEMMFHAYELAAPEGEFLDQANDGLAFIAECDYDSPLDRELDELSMDGKAALDAGDIEHAIDCLQKALEKDPSMTYVRNNLAVAYYCIGDMESAWRELRTVLEADPMDVHGRCNESMFCLVDGDLEGARRAVKKLRLEDIEELDELFKLCLALADTALDEELLLALKKIFLLSPYDVSMLYLYGVCQYNLGHPAESRTVFERLLLIEPDNLLAEEGRSLSLRRLSGEETPARLPYTFDLSPEKLNLITATLDSLLTKPREELSDALEDPLTHAHLHAALLGNEPQMSRAVLLLGMIGGKKAELLLREVLLSPTHPSPFKQYALETLHSIGAEEPYYALQDGKLVIMRTKQFELYDGLPPAPYLKMLRDTAEHMSKKYPSDAEEAVDTATGLWASYVFCLAGHYPRLSQPQAWIAVLEGLYLEEHGRTPDWDSLAEETGVSTRMLKMRRKKMTDALKQFDQSKGGDE